MAEGNDGEIVPTLKNPLFIHNTRSPEQWRIISEHVNFAGKRVVDYGCGYADILRHALVVGGAGYCVGVEEDRGIIKGLLDRFPRGRFDPDFLVVNGDVAGEGADFDIGICFSVLPYIPTPDDFLASMSHSCKTALIECQYAGDGPGFETIKDDDDMEEWLGCHWQSVELIGSTLVDYRDKRRTIWLCR